MDTSPFEAMPDAVGASRKMAGRLPDLKLFFTLCLIVFKEFKYAQ